MFATTPANKLLLTKAFMKQAELKKMLHAIIIGLDDKYVLYDLRRNIFPYVINYRTKKIDKADNNLTETQIIELDETISNADADSNTLQEVERSFTKFTLPPVVQQKLRQRYCARRAAPTLD